MIRDIKDMTSFKWATVRGTGPLQVQLDGDADPLALIPDSLVDPTLLKVGDRVRVELSLRKVVVHGKANGALPPPDPSLPEPWAGNGTSPAPVTSGTSWGRIPGALRLEWPAYDRDLLVDVRFGALGSTNSGYWMIGMSIFQSAGPAWNIPPEQPDPAAVGDNVAGSSLYGMYAPFSQSTQQIQLFGIKRVLIPAGIPSVFQMASRKSVAGATASMNYSSVEIIPIKWAD